MYQNRSLLPTNRYFVNGLDRMLSFLFSCAGYLNIRSAHISSYPPPRAKTIAQYFIITLKPSTLKFTIYANLVTRHGNFHLRYDKKRIQTEAKVRRSAKKKKI